jgi:nucleotide-binding universal stress UspA family protein
MKTYLVPTDYSDVADNAARYAIALAKKEQAKIVLFHVFQIPYPVAHDSYYPMISVDELEKDSMTELVRYRDKLLDETKNSIQIDCYTSPGFITEAVDSYTEHHPVDLVIMGITGGSKLKELFIGSNATSVARNIKKNVLIVPAGVKYRDIHKIGFATEYDMENEEKIEKQVKHFADLFHSNVVALNISTVEDLNTPEKEKAMETVKSHFSGYNFSSEMLESDDVDVEIENYVEDKKCDWLVVVPKHHNVFGNLFNKSLTKKLAYHLHVPILAVNELRD